MLNWLKIFTKELITEKTVYLKPIAVDFIRHGLGSVDLTDLKSDKTEQEQKDHDAQVSSVFKSSLEPVIKSLIVVQEQWIARNAKNEIEMAFGRGTLNGLLLLLEDFQASHARTQDANQPKGAFDEKNLFPEITKVDA